MLLTADKIQARACASIKNHNDACMPHNCPIDAMLDALLTCQQRTLGSPILQVLSQRCQLTFIKWSEWHVCCLYRQLHAGFVTPGLGLTGLVDSQLTACLP